jgi:hypothetical protein
MHTVPVSDGYYRSVAQLHIDMLGAVQTLTCNVAYRQELSSIFLCL